VPREDSKPGRTREEGSNSGKTRKGELRDFGCASLEWVHITPLSFTSRVQRGPLGLTVVHVVVGYRGAPDWKYERK
jgi:hypothetical protein